MNESFQWTESKHLVHWEHWIRLTNTNIAYAHLEITLQLSIKPRSTIRDYCHFWGQNISFKDRTIEQPKIPQQKLINKVVRWDCSRLFSVRQLTTGPGSRSVIALAFLKDLQIDTSKRPLTFTITPALKRKESADDEKQM